jgi:deazaflavin-dependent oxidoreductase (nitroreductase family)
MGRDTVPAAVADGIAAHRAAYLRSGGAQGHVIVHAGSPAGYALTTNLLIRFKGRKSGRTLITPLSYGRIGDEVVIVASKGGADEHPNWYLNLREAAEVEFQIATQAFRATWREPAGAEREKIWSYMVDCYLFYAEYQASTSRVIPLVLMKPAEEIPVFTEADVPKSV